MPAREYLTPIGPVGQIGILVADIATACDHYQAIQVPRRRPAPLASWTQPHTDRGNTPA